MEEKKRVGLKMKMRMKISELTKFRSGRSSRTTLADQ
jgi:hypothetical protein